MNRLVAKSFKQGGETSITLALQSMMRIVWPSSGTTVFLAIFVYSYSVSAICYSV